MKPISAYIILQPSQIEKDRFLRKIDARFTLALPTSRQKNDKMGENWSTRWRYTGDPKMRARVFFSLCVLFLMLLLILSERGAFLF
jgi:hypothetical protein